MSAPHCLRALCIATGLCCASVATAASGDPAPGTAPAGATTAPATTPPPAAATVTPSPAAPPPPSSAAAAPAALPPEPVAVAAPPPPVAPAPAAAPAPSGEASEDKSPPSSLEVALSIGPTLLKGQAANPEFDPSVTRVGVYGELAVAYRSSYFVDPFVSFGYGALGSGKAHLPDGAYGTGGTLEQHLGMWTISPGFTLDIWRFRPRFAIGLAIVKQKYEFNGDKSTGTQTPLVSQFGLGFVAMDRPRLRLDVEARAVVASGADVTFGTIDVILRGDLLYFGKH